MSALYNHQDAARAAMIAVHLSIHDAESCRWLAGALAAHREAALRGELSPPDLHALDKNYLRDMAEIIKAKLPDNHGFILLTFNFGPGGRVTYCANAERADCINAMKEFLLKSGAEEDWMKHIK